MSGEIASARSTGPRNDRDILNLGCGNRLIAGAVNHDLRKHREEVDVAWDLNDLPWPWGNETFDTIVACAVLEHLEIDLLQALNECWRILRPGGRVRMKLPYWKSDMSYRDPTHRWFFTLGSFDQFDPDMRRGQEYGFYTERKWKIVSGPRLNDYRTSVIVTMEVCK